ncbi:DUF4192 domain-containing protein [Nonomuraea rosea]|uniref:DUF4192 domain-containing protein n=1 Tax=Nonomuraea rosea TaxID=638574 RepID=A0ABP7A4A6_9ACTN
MTETVRLSHPADYLAIVPYLLGFHPAMSLMILAFRDGALITGMRHDLPGTAREHDDVIASTVGVLARNKADAVTVIGYGPSDQVTQPLDSLSDAITDTGMVVLQLLRCEHNRYWSQLETSPDDGFPYDISTTTAAMAAVVAGLCPLPDRAAVAACVAAVDGPDRQAVREATGPARERAETLLATASPRYWYDEGLHQVHDAFARSADDEPITPEQLAWLGVLLTSILVRDAAMTLLGTYPEEAHIKLWSEVTRRAEPGYVAAPALLLAFAAYISGAGTLTRTALDRALADNPTYSFAVMLDYALVNGLPGSMLHEMRIGELAEQIEAQIERCPRAALPRLPIQAEER